MGRVHLFELEDQPWFPAVIRDAATAYLDVAGRVTGQTRKLLPKLREALDRSGERRIVDLCTGSGGPATLLVGALADDGVEVTAELTDLYPNRPALDRAVAAGGGRIRYRAEPTDATAVPAELSGVRTIFNALHHLRPPVARAVLANAARDRRAIAVFELVGRTPPMLLGMLLAPIFTLLLIPLARPVKASWLVFTYLIPIVPLVVLWDGIVSCLRVYSPAELERLVAEIDAPGYRWDIGHVPLGPGARATYLVGTPPAA